MATPSSRSNEVAIPQTASAAGRTASVFASVSTTMPPAMLLATRTRIPTATNAKPEARTASRRQPRGR